MLESSAKAHGHLGLIEDRFAPVLSEKITVLDSIVDEIAFAPDDEELICKAIGNLPDRGCDIILL